MLQTLNITGIFKGKNFKRFEMLVKYGHFKIIGLHEISYLKNFPLPFGERVEG